MRSPAKATVPDNAFTVSTRTDEGLPLDPRFGTAFAAVDVGDGGPARRVDCRPPQLLSAPSIHTFAPKTPPSDVWKSTSLVAGPIDDSLMDDDDELMDYFSTSGSDSSPFTSPAVHATDDVMSPSYSLWNVRDHNIRTLPPFYPLEKSAVFVPQASASVLADRIADVLQTRSIEASYNAENAKVDCVSKSRVEFRIRLYRGRGESSHGIIVEVQRRADFALDYSQDVNAILDAAEGKVIQECSGGIAPTYYEETEGGEDMDSVETSKGIEALRIISDILCPKINKADQVTVEGRGLAMASLSSLTSMDHMGQGAVQLSNELLTSETHVDLRHYVFSQAGQDPNQPSTTQSLEILANIAKCSPNRSSLAELLSSNNHDLLAKLIANIENVRSNPHAGNLSCIILGNICISRDIVEESILQEHAERLISALVNAVCYGGECHTELQRHSRHLLENIV